MMGPPVCSYSNRLELLYEVFAEQWCSGLGSAPFARRLVLVNGAGIKQWLCQKLAGDLRFSVAFGLKLDYLETALLKLASEGVSYYSPSRESLTLAIELLLARNSIPGEIESLLKGVHGRQRARRLGGLASQIAELFSGASYGLLSHWKEERGWQSVLLEALTQAYPHWKLPAEVLEHSSDHRLPTTIHLFGIGFVDERYWSFLERLSQKLPVYGYLLSPCQLFWGDSVNRRQQMRLLRAAREHNASLAQQIALDELLMEHHTLLAGLGRLGATMANRLAISDPHPNAIYSISASAAAHSAYSDLIDDELLVTPAFGDLTALEALQADFVLLRSRAGEVTLKDNDRSLQCHIAPTRLREVEAVFDAICNTIATCRLDGLALTCADVTIAAPDISLYAPYLTALFDSKESPFPVKIIDNTSYMESAYYRALEVLLGIPEGRWEAKEVLKLFQQPPFLQAIDFSKEEALIIGRWIRRSGIDWGYDLEHCNAIFQKRGCRSSSGERATWCHGVERLLAGIVMAEAESLEEKTRFYPSNAVDSAETPLLGRWISILKALEEDLAPIFKDSLLSVSSWILYLRDLCNRYLRATAEEETKLLAVFSELLRSSEGLASEEVSFISLKPHFMASLQKQFRVEERGSSYGVRCSSLSDIGAIPSAILVLLGLEEENFPRKQLPSTFRTFKREGAYLPTLGECDRQLFLEGILSCRHTLILSCSGGRESASPLLTELADYTEQHYGLSIICEHPLASYDCSYFAPKSRLKSYSYSRYLYAKAFYGEEKHEPHRFLSHFNIRVENQREQANILSINKLEKFAKSPLSDFFKDVLKAPVPKKWLSAAETLALAKYHASVLRRSALVHSEEPLLAKASATGILPPYPLDGIYTRQLKLEVAELKTLLSSLGLNSLEFFSMELSDSCTSPQCLPNGSWLVPALSLEVGDSSLLIDGQLSHLSACGLIVFSKPEWSALIRSWPTFLVYCAAIERYQLPLPTVLQSLDHRSSRPAEARYPFFSTAIPHLKNFVSYYLQCRSMPSPLDPLWVPSIVEGNAEALYKVMSYGLEGRAPIQDNHLQWLLRDGFLPNPDELITSWQPMAEELYGEMATAWKKR